MTAAHPKAPRAGHAGTRPLGDVLAAMADELENARVLGLRVEQTICAIAVRAHLDAGIVGELQQLDAVLQRIAALRDFASALSEGAGSATEIETRAALERITLSDTRARLGGGLLEDDDDAWEFL